MKALTLIFALVLCVEAKAEGTVFIVTSDMGVTLRFLDSTCGDTNFFTALAIEEGGRIGHGCYVVSDADKTLTVDWRPGGMFQYNLRDLEVTPYGERYFDSVTKERTK